MQEPPLSRPTKAAYGIGAAALGLAIMIALIADAVLDPVIGQVSDNWRSRWGRRHPFMYLSALPITISYFLMWHPPLGWLDQAMFLYLIATAMVIRTFIAMFEIPSAETRCDQAAGTAMTHCRKARRPARPRARIAALTQRG